MQLWWRESRVQEQCEEEEQGCAYVVKYWSRLETLCDQGIAMALHSKIGDGEIAGVLCALGSTLSGSSKYMIADTDEA